MTRSLYLKITLAFITVAFLTAALVAVLVRLTSAERLTRLVVEQQSTTIANTLAQYYAQHGSWDGVETYWAQLVRSPEEREPQRPEEGGWPAGDAPERDRRELFGLADLQQRWVLPLQPDQQPGDRVPDSLYSAGTPVLVNGQRVGTLIQTRRLNQFNPAERMFLQRTNQALLVAMAGAVLLAVLAALALAGTLTRPLRALTQAAGRIAAGDLEQQVPVTSDDEIGRLAAAFNAMSREVARGNQLRRQMTADVAHDLRTPLTVISGYIESMRDGVLAPTPERLALIYEEIERLQNLVNDLRLLSLADAGELALNRQPVAVPDLLRRAADRFALRAGQQGVRLVVEAAAELPEIALDEARITQVLDNLITNALRFTPAGGTVTLAARQTAGGVAVEVRDTGAGIAPDDLPRIFERFHRADPSRHTDGSESGLGLAIVRAIVRAHGGEVTAESTLGHGATLRALFPR